MNELDDYLASLGFDPTTAYAVPESPTDAALECINAFIREHTCHSTTDDRAWCFACSECGKSFPRNQLKYAENHGDINYCPNCGAKVVEGPKTLADLFGIWRDAECDGAKEVEE